MTESIQKLSLNLAIRGQAFGRVKTQLRMPGTHMNCLGQILTSQLLIQLPANINNGTQQVAAQAFGSQAADFSLVQPQLLEH